MPSSARFAPPFFSFSSLRKKRMGAPGEEKEREAAETGSAPVSPTCDPAQRSQVGKEEGASEYGAFAVPGGSKIQLASSDAAPHAILMMAVGQHVTNTRRASAPTLKCAGAYVRADFFDTLRHDFGHACSAFDGLSWIPYLISVVSASAAGAVHLPNARAFLSGRYPIS